MYFASTIEEDEGFIKYEKTCFLRFLWAWDFHLQRFSRKLKQIDETILVFGIVTPEFLAADPSHWTWNTGQSEPIRYLLSALIFPAGVAWLTSCFVVSKLLPERYQWDGSKVASCIGAFLQVGFSTMSATSLAPMMCYKHPNGLRSILKYPGVLCGSADHDMMLVMGWILLTVFVLGFVALCTYAVMMDAWLLKVSLKGFINFIQQKTQWKSPVLFQLISSKIFRFPLSKNLVKT